MTGPTAPPPNRELLTAAAMVRENACTAGCLIASGSEAVKCGCPCKGTFHGVLSDVRVPGSQRPPRPPDPDGDPSLLDLLESPCP